METLDSYLEYTQKAIENFARRDAASRFALVDAVKTREPKRVLDLGCGAGQDILPFLEKTGAFCIGLDAAEDFGKVAGSVFSQNSRVALVRSVGERIPFADASFDVVLCCVALPYMNNRQAIAEVARVLQPGGVFLLTTHAPAFYFRMIKRGIKTFNPKQIAYPLICLAGGVWHSLTGKQLKGGLWQGKEVFQTQGFIEKECHKNNLRIKGFLPFTNAEAPSYVIVKK